MMYNQLVLRSIHVLALFLCTYYKTCILIQYNVHNFDNWHTELTKFGTGN